VGFAQWRQQVVLAHALPLLARGEPIGEVDTVFKFIGPDHKIVVDAYDDPEVQA
jgi:CreA protein